MNVDKLGNSFCGKQIGKLVVIHKRIDQTVVFIHQKGGSFLHLQSGHQKRGVHFQRNIAGKPGPVIDVIYALCDINLTGLCAEKKETVRRFAGLLIPFFRQIIAAVFQTSGILVPDTGLILKENQMCIRDRDE